MNEFTFESPIDLGCGLHRQTIVLDGKEVGFTIMREKNFLSPIEEAYLLPDVDAGISEPTPGLLPEKKGWIEFKRFSDCDAAYDYAVSNFVKIRYLFENGDWD